MTGGGCVLFGHQFDTLPGVGDCAGRMYRVCTECGKTEEIVGTDTVHAGLPVEVKTDAS